MDFQKLPSNSRALLRAIVTTDKPVDFLCDRFDKATPKEEEELRGMLRELKEKGFLEIHWADNKPYYILINNSARTYEEQLDDYNNQRQSSYPSSITIGNNNKISNSTIASNIKDDRTSEKKGFYEKHPIACGFLMSLLAGIVLLLPFWNRVVSFIERIIERIF